MPDSTASNNDFINKITEIIEKNISNEQFGVSELANEIAMSRSNLLRKIKKITKLSVSLFIRQVRLKKAMEMLKQTSSTVSEISYQVGFNSVSYFIKCFKDYYGFPPGEVGKRETDITDVTTEREGNKRKKTILAGLISIPFILIIVVIAIIKPFEQEKQIDKSIAVLPFKNDSSDSTNIYIINGLMEAILNNLQKIKDLRVISRTSVEKYRNSDKTIPEIAKELNVGYFLEGSGQKIGNKILLNVQLIEAQSDKHIWAEQYNRDTKDIFKIQMEVAKNIASRIKVLITPEENEQIDKIPTNNLVAYDYFLKGKDFLNRGNYQGLEEAIPYFKKAIEEDKNFARAYSAIAIAYYYLDIFQTEKKYTGEINNYADKAILLDPELEQALFAKALFYMHIKEYKQAVPYFEKALEYNPNSAMVINFLSDFYTSYIPNTEKYLEFALRGINLDIAANDSATASFIYLHVSNAFIQTGFVDEAERYVDKSLEYNPNNLYSDYVKAYIVYAKNKDLKQTKDLLILAFNKDTSRLDIMQEIANVYYYMRDFKNAYQYYQKFNERKETLNLDIYAHKYGQIGVVCSKMGNIEKANEYLKKYKNYCDNDITIYKHLSLAMYFAQTGDTAKAMENLRLFSEVDNYHYWTILFLEIDPIIDNIKNKPEFKAIMKDLKTKFWINHKRIKALLEENGLI